jgi:hypothetical protein
VNGIQKLKPDERRYRNVLQFESHPVMSGICQNAVHAEVDPLARSQLDGMNERDVRYRALNGASFLAYEHLLWRDNGPIPRKPNRRERPDPQRRIQQRESDSARDGTERSRSIDAPLQEFRDARESLCRVEAELADQRDGLAKESHVTVKVSRRHAARHFDARICLRRTL